MNDLIKSAPDTAIAIEFLIGGRVGVKPGKTVKIINEGEAAELVGDDWAKIVLPHQGILAKAFRENKPLTVLTRGGAIGIKG